MSAAYNFENWETREIQSWLRNGQIALDEATGPSREIWLCIIRGAAKELQFRWKHDLM
jgi:hypothetical protein